MSDDFAECGFALTAKLRAELYRVYNRLQEAHAERDAARADLAAARELLREARKYVFDALDGNCGPQVRLLARIDAALAKDEERT